MSDNSTTTTPPVTPPPTTWFGAFEPELVQHVTAKAWHTLDPATALREMAKAHFSAEKMIGRPPESLVPMPKDAADPAYAALYERLTGMATPQTAAEYTFAEVRHKDGTPLSEAETVAARDLAMKHKLPLPVARGVAADLAARADAVTEGAGATAEVAKAANQSALRGHWGSEYDQKAFSASRAAEGVGFTPEVLAYMATLPAPEYVKNMNALVLLGSQLTEASILRGGGAGPTNPTAGMTPEMASARFDELKTSAGWAAKALTPGTEEATLLGQLQAVMARGRVPG